MDKKGHIKDQKGLTNVKKGAKNSVFGAKILAFRGIFLSGMGGKDKKDGKKIPPGPKKRNFGVQKVIFQASTL